MWKTNFHQILSFHTHSTANLPSLAILKKIQYFQENHLVFEKTQILTVLRNLYFNRILRQIYYNLVIRKFEIRIRPPVILPEQLASKR